MADQVGDLRPMFERRTALEEEIKKELADSVELCDKIMLSSFQGRLNNKEIEMLRVVTRRMRREGGAPGGPGGQQVPTTAGTAGRDATLPSSGFSDRGRGSPEGGPLGGRTAYTDDQTSANRQNSARWQGSALGEDRIRQSLEQFIVPPAGGVQSHRAVDMEARRGSSTPELRRWMRWTMFAYGHLISATVMFSVMALLTGACFDEYLVHEDNDVIGSPEDGQSPQKVASSTKSTVFTALICFFYVEILLAVVMPVTYRSPLDLTSVHKLPLRPGNFALVSLLVTAPSLWCARYAVGAAASQALSLNSSCERQGGSGLGLYITISGIVMNIVACVFRWVTFAGMFIYVSSTLGCGGRWSAVARRIFRRHIVSKGLFLDVFWKLQSVVWLYRVGGSRMTVSVLLVDFKRGWSGVADDGYLGLRFAAFSDWTVATPLCMSIFTSGRAMDIDRAQHAFGRLIKNVCSVCGPLFQIDLTSVFVVCGSSIQQGFPYLAVSYCGVSYYVSRHYLVCLVVGGVVAAPNGSSRDDKIRPGL